jgi:multidrug efflux system outer membrane protein
VRRLAGLALAALAAGCLVGPDYRRPELDVPERYREPDPAVSPGPPAGRDWWELFGDPALDALELEARGANQDLQVAVARVEQARAAARIARSGLLPSLTLDPSYIASRSSPNRPHADASAKPYATDIAVPFDLGWELDLWGRVRRSLESATAAEHASEADYAFVWLTLSAEVAARYFALRSLDAQLATLRESVDIFADNLRLVSARERAGLVSQLDVAQAETQLGTTRERLADAQRQRAEAEHALAVLCGQPASTFALPERATPLEPPQLAAGVPSALLERRPDVAAAEQMLVAANADVGAATALLFPRVQLIGAAGVEGSDFGDLGEWESRIWALGAGVSAPIFEGGRLRANLAGAQARYAEQLAGYRQAVLQAFRDVEDALAAERLRSEQHAAVSDALDASRRAVAVSRSQYDHGLADYLQVIVAEGTHLDLELQDAQVREQRLDAAVQLVKAIGGGWQ